MLVFGRVPVRMILIYVGKDCEMTPEIDPKRSEMNRDSRNVTPCG